MFHWPRWSLRPAHTSTDTLNISTVNSSYSVAEWCTYQDTCVQCLRTPTYRHTWSCPPCCNIRPCHHTCDYPLHTRPRLSSSSSSSSLFILKKKYSDKHNCSLNVKCSVARCVCNEMFLKSFMYWESSRDHVVQVDSVEGNDDCLTRLSEITRHQHPHTHTYVQVFIRLRGSRKLSLATKLNLATSHNLATPLSYMNFTSQPHKC